MPLHQQSHISPFVLISPGMEPCNKSEAELFGAMVWLWMQSQTHRPCPLYDLERLLLPAIKTGQFVLAIGRQGLQQPLGLMTWANLSAQAEQRYMQTLDRSLQPRDWQSGDRPWILDWVVPFGRNLAIARATQKLLVGYCFRGLYHKGDSVGLRVVHFKGSGVSVAQEAAFWAARHLALAHPQQHSETSRDIQGLKTI